MPVLIRLVDRYLLCFLSPVSMFSVPTLVGASAPLLLRRLLSDLPRLAASSTAPRFVEGLECFHLVLALLLLRAGFVGRAFVCVLLRLRCLARRSFDVWCLFVSEIRL